MNWERRYTQRYEKNIYQRIQSSSIAQVSREEELSFEKVQGIFNHRHVQKNEVWGEVKRLGIDEVSQPKSHQDFVAVVANVDQAKLIEVVDSYKQEDIIKTLRQQPLEACEVLEEVNTDMCRDFFKVVKKVFSNAEIVFDKFHLMKPVNEKLNKICKQVKVTDKEANSFSSRMVRSWLRRRRSS